MVYPINPNACAKSTYTGPSRSSSTLATTIFPFSSSSFQPRDALCQPVILDGYLPIHPHHFYPTLFPPPTTDLPLQPDPSDTALATFYHDAVRSAQKWSTHLHAWSLAAQDAQTRPPPPLFRARGVETMHPHHFYPWLFDEPTPCFPLYVRNDDALAALYAGAVTAAREWVSHRQRWRVEEAQREAAREEELRGWEGLEEAAEMDGLWEQKRLDEEREMEEWEEELARELVRGWKLLDMEAGR
ncbi:hypothetical protein MMC11_001343 [Xylographa trunciseda]|nr:hypothetical protein [Xylographa trunciseda]